MQSNGNSMMLHDIIISKGNPEICLFSFCSRFGADVQSENSHEQRERVEGIIKIEKYLITWHETN